MIEALQLLFAFFVLASALAFWAGLAFVLWDTRSIVMALAGDVRKALAVLLVSPSRTSKATVGYDIGRATPAPTKADASDEPPC